MGDDIGGAGRALARHARSCTACRGFVDTLAAVRGWLGGAARAGTVPRPDPRRQVGRVRTALARELSARLARDLVALGEGRLPRPLASRRRDVDRLTVLAGLDGADEREDPPWVAAVPWLLQQARPGERAACLALARAMDPCGLDVALAHMGQLVRRGQAGVADQEADRLLLRIG